jgi:hypothetical protein
VNDLSGSAFYLSAGVITIVVFLELGLVALWIAVGAGAHRRSHFWARVLLASLGLPLLMAVLISIARLNVLSDGVAKALLSSLFFLGVVALMFVPCLLYRRSDSSSGPSESDDGGGPGPSHPRSSPDAPRGGLPLPDADPARARARDHNRPRFDHPNRRRPEHAPARTPAGTNP